MFMVTRFKGKKVALFFSNDILHRCVEPIKTTKTYKNLQDIVFVSTSRFNVHCARV